MFAGAMLEVNLSALRANYRLLKERHAAKSLAAVVKADAYGLGVAEISRALWEEGCREFFVATLEEGIELRQHLAQAAIGVFNGIFSGEEKEFQRHDLTPVLNTPEQIRRWQSVASLAAAIVHVDTGMTRLGLSTPELEALHTQALPAPAMLMSHLACADDQQHPKNPEQLARFKAALALFPGARASLANSAGIFLPEEYHFDLARPGCALYGINPGEGKNPMRHVATLSSPLLQIRTLDRDETVGYDATFQAKKGARIALAGIGYADGIFRHLSNAGFAYVAGSRVPIVGRISMDMIALDVSAIPEAKLAGAGAEFINERQTVSDLAEAAGTIGYEIFTRLGRRVKRVYG